MYHLNLMATIINNTIKDTIIPVIYQCTVLIRLDTTERYVNIGNV